MDDERKPLKRWEAIFLAVLALGVVAAFWWPRDSDWDTLRAEREWREASR